MSAPDSGTSVASYIVINSPCTQAISSAAVETSPFYGRVSLSLFFRPDGQSRPGERLADACVDERERFWRWLRYGSERHCTRGNITVDCCRGQYDSSKVQG